MGSSTSVDQQDCCGGCCYNYRKALDKVRIQIEKYQQSMKKNQIKYKNNDQQSGRQQLQKTKRQAYQLLKDNQQSKANRMLVEMLKSDKQGKANKEQELQKLKDQMVKTQKPKRKKDQMNQIDQFKEKFQRIKGLEFDKNKDQRSGDSGDYETYADRIINELKQQIQRENAQAEPIAMERTYSPMEYRNMFLKKLSRSGSRNGRTFRKLTKEEVKFFREKLGIQVGRNLTYQETSHVRRNQNNTSRSRLNVNLPENNQNSPPRLRPTNSVFLDSVDENQLPSMNVDSNINIFIPDQALASSIIENQPHRYDNEVGFYLNCHGLSNMDVSEFVKGDWSVVEVLDLQQCDITSLEWKSLTQAKPKVFPNLKVLYLGLNKIMEVNEVQLSQFRGVKYLSFGWWDQANKLSQQSKQVLENYQRRNPQLKIQFTHF